MAHGITTTVEAAEDVLLVGGAAVTATPAAEGIGHPAHIFFFSLDVGTVRVLVLLVLMAGPGSGMVRRPRSGNVEKLRRVVVVVVGRSARVLLLVGELVQGQ